MYPKAERSLSVQIGGRDLELRPVEESPCRRACPAGIDVKRYVGLIANGDFAGALSVIRKHMPFPSACGRICLHPCERECKRGEVDQPIAIMHLKRFVHDYEMRMGDEEPLPKPAEPSGRKIAVVGSGPAGLTAAHDLLLMGHEVTVFERDNVPGGNLTTAIPEFELPLHAVRRDIERIEKLGVRIECEVHIEGETGLQHLKKLGFNAILIATGASGRWSGFEGRSWIAGGDMPGAVGALSFMKRYRSGPSGGDAGSIGKVAVLGWGVQALACARTAIRLGCPEVNWIVPVAKEHLQPDPRLVEQAEDEGVIIHALTRPLAIDKIKGRVGGVQVVELDRGEADHTGRYEYKVRPGTEAVIPCDTVIDAAHFAPEVTWDHLSTGPWSTIEVDRDTMATPMPGVFAAGDAVSGAKSVVEAVALGHRSAEGIDRFLKGVEKEIGTLSTPIKITGWEVEDPARTPSTAFRPTVRPASERRADFEEAEQPFTVWQATHEARRCLLCGPCEECAVCLSTCYRKKGIAKDEKGNEVVVRMPLGVARGIREETKLDDREQIELYAAVVDPSRCRGCGVCEEICGYHAPRIAPDPHYGLVSSIDLLACKGCGTCVSACPSGAIDQGVTSLHAVRNSIRGGAG